MPVRQKIILFSPKPRRHTYSNSIPVALLKIASMIDRKKYESVIVSATPKYDYETQILKDSKDALCFAVRVLTGHDIIEAIELIKKIKKVNPNLPIVWGGWHGAIFPDQTLESSYADIIIRGQGERTFKELVERLVTKKDLKGLPGIIYKDKSGKIIHNPERPFEDINNFPDIPYDLINIDDYVDNFDGLRAAFYVTSQGCPFKCKFCAEPLVFKQRWSSLSNERILKDWEYLSKKGIEFIIIGDDNFFVNEKKVKDFCEKFIAKKLPLKWGRVSGRVRQMLAFSDETWQLIKDTGCTDIQVGAETGDQNVLDYIGKELTVDEIVQFIERARKFKIKATPAFILGLPTEEFRKASSKEIQKLLDKQWNAFFDVMDRCYKDHKDYDEIRLFAYDPYPGNPLYDLSCELGFDAPKKLEEWAIIRPAPWIKESLREKIRMLQYFLFPYARDGYAGRHIKKFKLLQKLFHKSAQWRWKHRFFALPIEYKMYRAYTNLRTKKTGQSATDHE